MVLQGLHRLWPPLIEFADQLAADLGHPTQVNAYITPPSSRGFSPHYDVHDVFVLQVAGEKHWRIHAPVLRRPAAHPALERPRGRGRRGRRGEPVIDAVLRPGDALYLPRGFLHSATALGEISAHLTIGVHPVTRWAAAESALDLVRDPRRRRPVAARLPPPRRRPGRPRRRPRRRRRRDRRPAGLARAGWTPTDVADRLRARTWAQVRPEPVAPLAQSTAAAALSADTVLRLRRRLRCALRDGDDGGVDAARRPAHALASRREARAALTALLAAGELKVGDLPGLDRAERLVLARRLVTESIATVPDAGSSGGSDTRRPDPTRRRGSTTGRCSCRRWPAATPPSPPPPRRSAGC